MSESAEVDPADWLMLTYRLPREPSRLRATVWRRLRQLGAVYLQNSVAVLPFTTDAERAVRMLRNEVLEMGGSAQVIRGAVQVGGSDLVAIYNAARDEEYREVVDRCEDFFTEIRTETAKEHFTFAELEENDEDLLKLRSWLAKIVARDLLGAPGRGAAEQALEDAATALAGFAERVYRSEAGEGSS